MLNWFPGVGSLDDAARGEIGNLSDDRQDFQGKYDFGDRFRGWLGGYTEEDVRARSAELRRKDINRDLSRYRRELQTAVAGTPMDTGLYKGINQGQTIEDYKQQLFGKTAAGTMAQRYLALPNASISDLKPTTSATNIISLASQLQTKNKDAAELKAENKLERERAILRADRETQFLESNRRYDNELALRREQIEANIEARKDNIDLSRLKLQMDQDRYMYEADTRKQEKREQRIAALTQALTGLGASFFI